jgi:hypothetical protein
MMNASQCRERIAAAREAADAASGPDLHDAWQAVAHEWEVIAAIAELQRSLMRPGAGPH